MKLSNWNDPGDFDLSDMRDNLLQEADIEQAHRFIYLFFNQDDIDNHKRGFKCPQGSLIFGKAIQINLSVSKSGQDNYDLPVFYRGSRNSTYMTVNMYVYDTIFESSLTNIRNSQFTLINSMGSSSINDYDLKKTMYLGVNFYEKDIRDKPDMKDLISSMLNAQSPSIPEPMYYTETHQQICSDEIYCINSLNTTIMHRGEELIDVNTRISVMNKGMMDSLQAKIKSKLAEVRVLSNTPNSGVNMYDQTLLSEMLLYQDFESMQNGYTYIYDSDLGYNIVKNNSAFIPFRKFQFDEKVVGDLERTMQQVKFHAQNTEKNFGHLRISFTPTYYGDKLDVYFKDYNKENQPVIKESLSIDNGSKIKTEMSNIIDDAQNHYEQEQLITNELEGYIE